MESKKYMKAVVMHGPNQWEYRNDLKEIPVPGNGEVLIRVEAAVINPSDTYLMRGFYTGDFHYPFIPGNEGSGVVIQSGGGIFAWNLVGKRVAFIRPTERSGLYSRGGAFAEYIVTQALQCFVLNNDMSFEQGATAILNPFSAVGMLDTVKQHKPRAVIQTAAYSQFGRMMIRLFRENNITCINIVRKEDQAKILREDYQCKYVINSSEQNYLEQLKAVIKETGANLAMECIGGETTGEIVNCLPKNSTCIVFGNLCEENIKGIDSTNFLFYSKRIESWFMPYWMRTKSKWALYWAQRESFKLVEETKIYKVCGLHEISQAIEEYLPNMSKGKFILKPSLSP